MSSALFVTHYFAMAAKQGYHQSAKNLLVLVFDSSTTYFYLLS
jgi:hypothetical protein